MTGSLKLSQLNDGIELPGLTRTVTQPDIDLYAEAGGDHNPVHLDNEFAVKAGLGGTVAHGMLVLAYISQMMTQAFGLNWLQSGKLDVRFKAAARPGDTLTVSGKVAKLVKADGQTTVTCSVHCINDKGEQVITGEAAVTLLEV